VNSELTKRVLAEEVKDYLLQRILDGAYPPGSRIVETSIARDIGVSQAPVREALRSLEAAGLIHIEPYRGARVHIPSVQEMLDANRVRTHIETLAVELTADDVTIPAELARAYTAMVERAAAGDRAGYVQADFDFHATIVGLPGNRALTRAWQALEPACRTYVTTSLPELGLAWASQLHTPILEALTAGTKTAACDAITSHFDRLNEFIARSAGRERRAPETPDP
jgi:DNA-binding GntR family transcriptional regulator